MDRDLNRDEREIIRVLGFDFEFQQPHQRSLAAAGSCCAVGLAKIVKSVALAEMAAVS
jgi:hypothetical protein